MTQKKSGRWIRAVIRIGLSVLAAGLLIDAAVVFSTAGRIRRVDELTDADIDTIIVFGAGYRADNSPSPMLADRVAAGVEVQQATGAVLLLSGDSQTAFHDETAVMQTYALSQGADPDKITTDGLGLSTYETLWRARNLYGADQVVVVTQRYHLYRAMYIARALGMTVTGVSATRQGYGLAMLYYESREMAARVKDFFQCLWLPAAGS